MKILVACEESQVVTKAFRVKGHEAYSADIKEPSGGKPEWHIKGDVIPLLQEEKWDMIIAFPPCTYLSNAAANILFKDKKLNEERYKKGLEAKEFFMKFYNANCKKIAVENPIPMKIFELPPYTQIIQPFYFGEPYRKATCLWLKGLPPLMCTSIVMGDIRSWVSSYSRGGIHRNPVMRSKTFPGIAKTMAEQWG